MKAGVWLVVIALAAVIGVFQQCSAVRQREIGALREASRGLERSRDSLKRDNDSLRWQLDIQEHRLRRTIVRRETVLDSILVHDTITLTHRESVLVAVADTAIRACTDAFSTCQSLIRTKDRLLANRDSALRVALRSRSSFLDRRRDDVIKIAFWELIKVGVKAARK